MNKQEWIDIHKHWLCDVLGFKELYEVEKRHSREEFDKLASINNAKITCVNEWDMRLYNLVFDLDNISDIEKELGLSLSIPDDDLILKIPVTAQKRYTYNTGKSGICKEDTVISFAMVGKNFACYSVLG